jgi:hypothetical protein
MIAFIKKIAPRNIFFMFGVNIVKFSHNLNLVL